MKNWKILALLIITLLLVWGLASLIQHPRGWSVPRSGGQKSDAFHEESQAVARAYLYSVDGKKIELKTFRGKWLLLNFWATWCGPCRMEMPDLDEVYRREHGAGLEMLGVSDEDVQVVRKFLSQQSPGEAVHYPIACDPGAQLHQDLSTSFIPFTLVVNPGGHVVAKLSGAKQKDDFLEMLRKVGFRVR